MLFSLGESLDSFCFHIFIKFCFFIKRFSLNVSLISQQWYMLSLFCFKELKSHDLRQVSWSVIIKGMVCLQQLWRVFFPFHYEYFLNTIQLSSEKRINLSTNVNPNVQNLSTNVNPSVYWQAVNIYTNWFSIMIIKNCK